MVNEDSFMAVYIGFLLACVPAFKVPRNNVCHMSLETNERNKWTQGVPGIQSVAYCDSGCPHDQYLHVQPKTNEHGALQRQR